MKDKKKMIVVALILLAIGFAAVTTTLVLNGNTLFGTNNDSFDVYFSKAIVDGVEDNTVISQDGKSITYETANLQVVGDTSILDYTVTNNSSQYDAKVSIECDFTGNEYVTLENSLEDEIIEAKSEEIGTLTATLIKTSTEERTQNFVCTIVAEAVERETEASDPIIDGESNTYSLYGYLVDDNDNPLANHVVVAYDNSQYATTSEDGYLYTENLEKGSHTLYVLSGVTIEDIENLSEEEIETQAITSTDFTTGALNIVFANGYRILDTVIEKTKTITVSFDPNGVDVTIEDKTYTLGKDVYGELPELTRVGNWTFDGWYTSEADGTKIESTTRVSIPENHTLYARWVCAVGDVCIVEGTGETIEDILQIGNEQFHVISNDGTNIKMMSMYNLYIGGWSITTWQPYENPTGLQDSTMLGYNPLDTSIKRGVTPFSGDNQKGENYSDYTGSMVEIYVNNYSLYLADVMKVENTATLISKEDLESILGVTLTNGNLNNLASNVPSFLYSTSYWTRSPYDANLVWRILKDADFLPLDAKVASNYGVRPVVTISSSLI